jgi:hypothetical protein
LSTIFLGPALDCKFHWRNEIAGVLALPAKKGVAKGVENGRWERQNLHF